MSALTMDEAMTTYTKVRPVRRASQPRPAAAVRPRRPRPALHPSRPAAAPLRLVAQQPVAASWQLTDRGIAVIVVGFLLLCAIATAVVIGAFLAVPNTPLAPAAAAAAQVADGS